MGTVDESLRSTGRTSSDMETSEPLPMSSEWMCFVEGSPVRTSPTLGLEPALTAKEAASGLNSRDSFAHYDRGTQSWRTSQLCFTGELTGFSETWPRAGSMRNGKLYQRRPLERTIGATDYGSLPIVPTPTSCDHKGSGRLRIERGPNNNLRDYFKINWRLLYPPVAVVEYILGYPTDHTALEPLETLSSRRSSNGLEDE